MSNSERNGGDLCAATAAELAAQYTAGTLSPVEATKAALERAHNIQDAFNAFTIIDHDGALTAARAAEKRWRAGEPASPIDGVTLTIKDVAYCHGLDVRFGSKTTPETASFPDAPVVERLRNAGAVILGITTTPEFGWKPTTDNPKDGITRNPWNRSRTSGGSSGGAAVAAATGAGVLHLGSDGGGSIRIPASFTGVVGHKPTFGRIGVYPASSFGTLAHIGPLTRTVEDATAMLNVMAGRDLRDWTQPPLDFGAVSPKPIDWSNKRIAYWKTPFLGTVDQVVLNAVESVLKDLELAGATITETRLPDHDSLLDIFQHHWLIGAATRLSAIDPRDHHLMDPGLVKAAQTAQRYTAIDYMRAEIRRVQFGARMELLFRDFDYLISPTVAIPPFEAGQDVPKGSGMTDWIEWLSFTFPANLSQQPTCSVPCGQTADGLPIGLQITGPRGDDEGVLSAALTLQEMYPERFIGLGGKWPGAERESAAG